MSLKSATSLMTIGSSTYLRIPYNVWNDSEFPFIEDDILELEVTEIGKSKILVVRKQNIK